MLFFFLSIYSPDLISCFTVAFNGKRHRHIPWYHILVYMGYLASKKEWISSSARVGYWGRRCLSIRIPPSTMVCVITVTIYLSNRHGWCTLVRTVGQVVLDTSHLKCYARAPIVYLLISGREFQTFFVNWFLYRSILFISFWNLGRHCTNFSYVGIHKILRRHVMKWEWFRCRNAAGVGSKCKGLPGHIVSLPSLCQWG